MSYCVITMMSTKTGSTLRIALSSDATTTGNVDRKCEVWACGFWDMRDIREFDFGSVVSVNTSPPISLHTKYHDVTLYVMHWEPERATIDYLIGINTLRL